MSTTAPARPISDVDVEAFVRALDDAPDVPCAYRNVPGHDCPMAARWAYACASCGHDFRVCTEHMLRLDHAQHRGLAVACGGPGARCRTFFPTPIPWRAL